MILFPIKTTGVGFTILLGMLAALPSVSIDINAPTLIIVQTQLLSPAGVVGLTITLFMVGFAAGQLAAGPVSDRWGRRPILLLGLSGYTLAGLGCAAAASIEALIGWRLLQGVGAGACSVLAFTIIRDLFEGDVALRKRSYVTVVFGLAPMLAPSLGAWVLDRAGWRPVYALLAVAGVALLVVAGVGLEESRPADTSAGLPSSLWRNYGRLLQDWRFIGLAAVNALSYAGMFAYIAASPLVLMGTFGLSAPGYGVVFACTAAALVMGAWTSGRYASAGVASRRLLAMSLTMAVISALALTILLMMGVASLLLVLPVLCVSLFCRGIVAPNAQHLALEPFREHSGSAAAAMGVVQILAGAVSSALVAMLFPILGELAMAIVMTVLALGSLTIWLWISRIPERDTVIRLNQPSSPAFSTAHSHPAATADASGSS